MSFFFFLNIYLFYYYYWLWWVFVATCGLSLVALSGGFSSFSARSTHWAGLSYYWSTGSRRVGFSSWGSLALECGLSSCSPRAGLPTACRASQVVLVVKNPPANARDLRDAGLISGSGRTPGGGHGNPLQYSCLENPMDRVAWWAIGSQRVGHDWGDLARMHMWDLPRPGIEPSLHFKAEA